MSQPVRCEWDSAKERSNLRKHGVSFSDAVTVLSDSYGDVFHRTQIDRSEVDHEDRWVTFASHPYKRDVDLCIVWTRRSDDIGDLIRIISARPATNRERYEYEKEIFPG